MSFGLPTPEEVRIDVDRGLLGVSVDAELAKRLAQYVDELTQENERLRGDLAHERKKAVPW